MKKQLLLSALLLVAVCSSGQVKTDAQSFIEVTGTAETEVTPDEIYIEIILTERYQSKVKISIEEQEEKLKNALKVIEVDLKNLYLSDANADFIRIRWQKKDVITQKAYTLKVPDAATVNKVFTALEKLDINDASIKKVNYSRLDSLKREIKIKAIKAAKEQADYLLSAIGEQTGKALIITENSIPPRVYSTSSTGAVYSLNGGGPSFGGSRVDGTRYYIDGVPMLEQPVEFRKIKVESSIYVKFAIK